MGKRFDGRHTGGFDVHEGMCAICACVTRAWQSHHVWQLRRLDLEVESVDVRGACEQCGNVGGRPLVFVRNVWISMPLVSCVSAVFLVVDLRACDKTLCTIWWVRGDSDRPLPATCSLRCSVRVLSALVR